MELVAATPFDEAVAKLGSKSPVASILNSAQWADVPPALRDRAFFSATVESVRFLQRAQDSLKDFVAGARDPVTGALKTGSRAAFVQQMQRFAIAEGMGPLKPADKGTIKDITSQQRLGLIFEVQTRSVRDYGNWRQGMDPAVLDEFPAQRFIRERRVKKARAYHQAALGKVALKTDLKFWISLNPDFGVPWGPWGFGSGCGVEDVDRAATEKLGLLKPGQKVNPATRRLNDGLKASLKGLDQPMIDLLKNAFGAQVAVLHDTVYWTAQDAPTAPRPPRPKAPVAPAAPPPDVWPSDLSTLKVVKKLGGATGAELVEDPTTGRQFVRKSGANAGQLLDEAAADNAYRALGVAVPDTRVYTDAKGNPVKLGAFINGAVPLRTALANAKSAAEREVILGKVKSGYAADALLANWDVAGNWSMGPDFDNILVGPDGTPYRIDNGGALRYSGLGTLNPSKLTEFPKEIWTLRDEKLNPSTGKVFAGLDIYSIARQIEAVVARRGELLAALPADLQDVVGKRLTQMEAMSRKALDMEHDHWKAGYADELTRHMMGLREAGIVDALPKELTQAPGGVRPKDENGVDFDDMRTRGAGAAVATASDPFYADLLAAAKTLNHHGGSVGDFTPNMTKVNAALAQETALKKLAKDADPAKAKMGKYYLKVVEEIKAALAGSNAKTSVPVSNVKAYPSPAAKPAAATPGISLVKRVADYMTANGANQAAVAAWMGEHAGDSWKPQARAYKTWLVGQRTAPSSAYWWKMTEAGCDKQLDAMRKTYGATLDNSFTIWHALVQEVLGAVDFRYNDRDRRAVRIIRTEELDIMKNVYKLPVGGKTLSMPRGPNESGSIFTPYSLHGDQVTIQAVPHTQITALYFLERSPGYKQGSLLGDNENEFTFIGEGVPLNYLGKLHSVAVPVDGGSDASAWDLDLSHLRP